MLKSANKTETNIYTLEVSVSGEDFNKAILQAYNKQKNKIQLPGFRKGKAPLKMIEKFYGEGVFYEDALDIVYPGVVGKDDHGQRVHHLAVEQKDRQGRR